jgi:hypothetical protein
VFKVGNNNSPSTWIDAPAPTAVSVRVGAGTSGSDRVEFVWANNAIQKQWLEVVVLANANTGLPQLSGAPAGQGDIFFFGNALADTGFGNVTTQATVNATDDIGARNHPQSIFSSVLITNVYDFNRDGAVNVTDALNARNNASNIGNVVKFLSLGNPPAAPLETPNAVSDTMASVLVMTSTDSLTAGSSRARWFEHTSKHDDSAYRPLARLLEHLAAVHPRLSRASAIPVDRLADLFAVDDWRVDSIVSELELM